MDVKINSREAHVMPDGSGFVVAGENDHPWQLTKDILIFQGIEHPNANEIHALYKKITRLNGRKWKNLSEGRVVDFPANPSSGKSWKVNDVLHKPLLAPSFL